MQSLFACNSLTFDLRLYTAYAIAHIADSSCLPLASGLDRGIFVQRFFCLGVERHDPRR